MPAGVLSTLQAVVEVCMVMTVELVRLRFLCPPMLGCILLVWELPLSRLTSLPRVLAAVEPLL